MTANAETVEPPLLTRDFFLVCLLSFSTFSSFYVLLAILPIYVLALGGDSTQIGLVSGAFATSAMLFRPFVGLLMDRIGRVTLIRIGSLISLVAGVGYLAVGALAPFLAVRILHGSGFASISTGGNVVIGDLAPPKRRGEAVGYYGMFNNLALAMMPAIGLLVYSRFGLHSLFVFAASWSVVALTSGLLMREPARTMSRPGAVAPAALGRAAIVPCLVAMLLSADYGILSAFIPVYAPEAQIADPSLFFTVYAISVIIARTFSGQISDRFGRTAAIVPGLGFASAAMLAVGSWHHLYGLIFAAVAFALAMSLGQPALNALVIDQTPPERRGAALGLFIAAFDLGIGSGAFFFGWVASQVGYQTMFQLAGALPLVAGAILALNFWLSRPSPVQEQIAP